MKMRINIPPSDFCWFILNFMISNLFLLFGIFHFELWFPNFRLSCFAENLHQSTAMGTYLKIWLRIYFHISVGFSFYLRIYVQPNSHIFYSNRVIYIFFALGPCVLLTLCISLSTSSQSCRPLCCGFDNFFVWSWANSNNWIWQHSKRIKYFPISMVRANSICF